MSRKFGCPLAASGEGKGTGTTKDHGQKHGVPAAIFQQEARVEHGGFQPLLGLRKSESQEFNVMKQYNVSLLVYGHKAGRRELSRRLGKPSSYDILTNSGRAGVHADGEVNVWRLTSDLPAEQPLETHLANLADKTQFSRFYRPSLPAEWKVILDIVVLYDTYTCTLSTRMESLKFWSGFVDDVVISMYPTDFTATGNN